MGIFSFFKSRRPQKVENYGAWDDVSTARKVWTSDEDRGRWVADHKINSKASDFIDRIHKHRFSECEPQTVTVCPPANA